MPHGTQSRCVFAQIHSRHVLLLVVFIIYFYRAAGFSFYIVFTPHKDKGLERCSVLDLCSVEPSLLFFPNLIFGIRYCCHVCVQAALLMETLCQPQTLSATNDLIDVLRQLSVTVEVHRLIKLCY